MGSEPRKPLTEAERKKKSLEADRQLERKIQRQTMSAGVQTEPQTQRTQSSRMTTKKNMLTPGARDAPKFYSKKPQELRRFVRLMEDLWDEAGIEDDDMKKSMIGKYADQESEEEWSALESFETGYSWLEFKTELIENYPEAAEAERGTPARLRQLCRETSSIRLGDLAALYAFRRAFMAEAKKLVKAPAAMANRELVELFIGCLSEPLASAVLQFLGSKLPSTRAKMKAAEGSDVVNESGASRRPEDRYDLEEVCRAAIQVSESSQGMFNLMKKESLVNLEDRGVFLYNQPVSETKALSQKLEELEGVQALEKDRVVSLNKTMESKMSEIENMIKTLLQQGSAISKSATCKSHESGSGSMQKGNKSMDGEKCFYCGAMGHFLADCPELKSQVQSGNLKWNPEGKLRLRDGSFIPMFPGQPQASMKERVERHYSKRPSQFFYGEYEEDDPVSSFAPKYPAQFLHMNETSEQRRARLEKELDLKEKEDALELRKLKLEREEKRLEKASGSSRAANLLDLTDDELVAIKAARLGFP